METERPTDQWHRLATDNLPLVWWAVKRYCRSATADEQEELAAEGFLALVRAARNFDPERRTKFCTYALCVIRKQFIQLYRRSQAQCRGAGVVRTFSLNGYKLATEESDEEGQQKRADYLRQLLKLARLSERAKTILRLHYWEGLTQSEIAGLLSISVQQVKDQMYRARNRMKDMAA